MGANIGQQRRNATKGPRMPKGQINSERLSSERSNEPAAFVENMANFCGCGNAEYELPLMVVRQPSRFFKNYGKSRNAEDDMGEEKGEEWEHFIVAHAPRPSRSHGRRLKGKHAKGNAGQSFDHEASFNTHESGRSSVVGSNMKRFDGEEEEKKLEVSHTFNAVVDFVRQNNIEEVTAAVKKMTGLVREADGYQQTLLFWAANLENPTLVNVLLDFRSSPNVRNLNGYTPLMRSLCHGQMEASEMLFRAQGDILAQDKYGGTALSVACGAGQMESVDWILQHKQTAALVVMRDEEGCTPLLVAARAGHSLACRALLRAKAQPNTPDNDGRVPLLFALARNDVELASALLDNEADVNVSDSDGKSVVMSLVENALKHPKHREASICGLVTAFEAGADPDGQDDHGNTSLLLATKARDPLIVTILCAYGADPAIPDDREITALMFARSKGYTDICHVLRDFGADKVKRSSTLGRSFLRAAYYGNSTACKKLLERAADPEVTTRNGTLIKTWVENYGHPSVLESFKAEQENQEKRRMSRTSVVDNDDATNALKRCHQNLSELRQRSIKAQSYTLDLDLNSLRNFLQEVIRLGVPEESFQIESVGLLNGLCRVWHQHQLLKGFEELRRVRAVKRQEKLDELGMKLKAWSHSNTQEGTEQLRKTITHHIMAVNGYAVDADEWQDAQSKKSEDVQSKALKPVLHWVNKFPQLCSEEIQALRGTPKEVDDMLSLAQWQCPHCLGRFTGQDVLDNHVTQCQSSTGLMRRMELAAKREQQAEIFTMRMASVAIEYHKYTLKGKAILDGELVQCRQNARGHRDARYVIRGCMSLIETLTTVAKARNDEAWIAAKSFFEDYPKLKIMVEQMGAQAAQA